VRSRGPLPVDRCFRRLNAATFTAAGSRSP
jgi:hypothetical protein